MDLSFSEQLLEGSFFNFLWANKKIKSCIKKLFIIRSSIEKTGLKFVNLGFEFPHASFYYFCSRQKYRLLWILLMFDEEVVQG